MGSLSEEPCWRCCGSRHRRRRPTAAGTQAVVPTGHGTTRRTGRTTSSPTPEDTGGENALAFTASLSAPAPQPIEVTFATANGTATAPADFVGDSADEDDETMSAAIGLPDDPGSRRRDLRAAPSGFTDGFGIGTIADDDTTVVVPVPPAAELPALSAASVLSFPETRSCVSRRKFSIRLRIPEGLAVRDVVVRVNGKKVKTVKGTRKYRTCVAKKRSTGKPRV